MAAIDSSRARNIAERVFVTDVLLELGSLIRAWTM